MVSFEIFVKAMPPSLSELKVLPSFCFAFKIPDDLTASIKETLLANNGRDQNRVHKARQVADILTAPRQQSDPVHVGWL